jgi:hypothetical protein
MTLTMPSVAPVSSSFITRPQAPVVSARPAPSQATEAAPVREPDKVELSGVAVEPVEPVERKAEATELSEEETKQVEALKARDAEVKAHEQAHVAAAGPYFRGGPNYSYERGPDGNRYAVGGSVQIDTSPVAGDPEATIAKAQTVRRAALAPAEPSSTDQQVAAAASRMEAEAQRELAEQNASESTEQSVEGGESREADRAGEAGPVRTDTGEPKNDEGETEGAALDVFA